MMFEFSTTHKLHTIFQWQDMKMSLKLKPKHVYFVQKYVLNHNDSHLNSLIGSKHQATKVLHNNKDGRIMRAN